MQKLSDEADALDSAVKENCPPPRPSRHQLLVTNDDIQFQEAADAALLRIKDEFVWVRSLVLGTVDRTHDLGDEPVAAP